MSIATDITPQVTQTQVYDQYQIFFDNAKSLQQCHGKDPLTGQEIKSDGYRAYCTKLNPTLCPTLPAVGAANPIWTNQGPYGRRLVPNGQAITCQYPIDRFTSLESVVGYLEAKQFGNSLTNPNFGDSTLNTIMQEFCSSQASTTNGSNPCPENPLTGKVMPLCSNFVSKQKVTGTNQTAGGLCTQWANDNLTTAQAVRQNYCQENPMNEDCACINRTLNATYNEISGVTSGAVGANSEPLPDRCWWVPCKNPDTFLPCSTCNGGFPGPPPDESCPSVCDVIVNATATGGSTIDVNSIKTATGCSVSKGSTRNTTTGSRSGEIIDRFGPFLIGVIIFFIVAIIVIILYRARTERY